MKMMSPKSLLKKLVTIKISGKGKSGDFFGRYNKVVVFVKLKEKESLKFEDVVDVKIIGATEKVAFAELLPYSDEVQDGY